jgi:predicted CoA-binding protein
MSTETVAVVGASPKPERYSYKAMTMLQEYGHHVLPVNPAQSTILNLPVFASIKDLPPVDTITLYVGPEQSSKMAEDLLAAHPKRVIFNPGAENAALAAQLSAAGIQIEEACTLVLLRTHQF